MAELQWLRPGWLLAIFPVLGLWWWLWRREARRARWQRLFDPQLLPHLLVGEHGGKGLRPIHLLLPLWLLVVVALAGPSWRLAPSPFDTPRGLVVLLKTGASMKATDVQPSRLERAKQKIRDLLALRPGAPTGLVVYSGSAHLVMPLTRDAQVIPPMLEDLDPDLMPVEGDALVAGLQRAQALLTRSGTPGSILVIADAVSPAQAGAVTPLDVPVQFLAVQAPGLAEDAGLRQAASALGAGVEPLSVDDSDVRRIARRARSLSGTGGPATAGRRAEDAGYYLLPLILLLALFWCRRGWGVR